MIDLTVILTAKDHGRIPKLRELLATHTKLSRAEAGCLRFDAWESESVPGTFILTERWESETALYQHRTATGFTSIYAPQVLPLVDRVAHVCHALSGT